MKIMPDNKSMASGTIFDEIDYDEMQKTENHEIGYNLFRIMFFVELAFAIILVTVCSKMENIVGTVISLAFFAFMALFYVLYAYMTAKKGIMNPKFAKSWSNNWVIIAYIIILIIWIFFFIHYLNSGAELWDYAICTIWFIACTEAILMYLCAKKNNRVLKKQLEESEAVEE